MAGGPDVWEVVARLRSMHGPEERRIAELTAETALHPRAIRIALDYASHHPEEVGTRIDRQREAAHVSERAARQRSALLG